MGSTAIALAFSAMTMSAGNPIHPAQASISPAEREGLRRDYSISAGPIDIALNSFADRSGLHIVFDARLTESMTTPGVSGVYSVEEGLDRLLSGTGLTYRLAENGRSVSIILAQATTGITNDASGATPLPPIDVGATRREASGESSGAPKGPGDRHTGYMADRASSALKVDAPLIQTPISVQVITRQTMDDQQAISVRDALVTNSSGVTVIPSFFDVLKVRGFATFGSTYKGGLQEYRYRYLDTANLQSIEILKGPAAMLFGRMDPGGIVNLVVKRPLETPYYSLEEQIGSYGLTRTTFDATGPVTADKSVLYRFNGEFYRTNSYRDFVVDRNVFLAPTITLHPIEQFRMNIDFEYQNRVWVDDFPIYPAVGAGPASLPPNRYLSPALVTVGMPDNFDKKRIAYDWTYDFLPGWSLTNRLSYANVGYRTINGFPGAFDQSTGVLSRSMTVNYGYTDKLFATNLDLKGKFDTGPLQHSILLGYDYFSYFTPLNVAAYGLPASSINVYAPNYAQLENIYPAAPSYSQNGYRWNGIYGQDMISFLDDSFHVLLGGRYDWALTSASKNSSSPAAAQISYITTQDQAFSPRLGVVYQPLSWLSFYGSFTRSLGLNNATTQGALPPQKGEQFEGGAKAELFDKRLMLTMAYFDITKTNIPTPDPTNARNTLLIGKARSRGIEVDLTGRIDDNWSIIANYTHDDVRTVEGSIDTPLNIYNRQLAVAGRVLASSPRNYGNIWVKYEADGALRGLSVGGGLSVTSSSLGDNANSFILPGYALLNGMIAYSTKIQGYTITAQLNVKNITDAAYYPGSGTNRFNIMTGTPRTFLVDRI
ncbi:MAG: TonB-dependent siderophore receptor [Methylocystaceae bacterium]|nr:MAG: TonB-dependent siderophore receptor [Methylocystaceae bacterium]